MNNFGKLVIAVLAGVAAGTVIGLLIAPEKGGDTRKKIRDAIKDAVDASRKMADGILGKDKKSEGESDPLPDYES